MATQMPSKGELKKNLKALKQRLQEKPMDLDARMRIARTFRLLGNKDDAVAHYGAVARYLSLAGHPLQAIAVLKELLQIDPGHDETLLFLAKLYARTRAADATNRGRVAIPILDGGPVQAFAEGLPLTATGIWRAIQPIATDAIAAVKDADEIGARIETSGEGAPAGAVVPADDSKLPAVSVRDELRALQRSDDETRGGERVLSSEDVIESEVDPDAQALGPSVADGEDGPTHPKHGKQAFGDDERTVRDGKHRERDAPGSTLFSSLDRERAGDSVGDGVDSIDPGIDVGDDFEVVGHVAAEDLLLPQVPLFSSLSPEAFVSLGHAMIHQKVKRGTVVFAQGEPGDSCVVIARGRARVTRTSAEGDDVELMQLGEGDLAGVFALMAEQARQASLTAVSDLEYFEIDRLAVDELIGKHPSAKAALRRFFRDRLLLNVLATLPFFSRLEPSERKDLVRRFSERDYAPGDELFFEGAQNDGIWVILEGRCRLQRDGEGSDAGNDARAGGDSGEGGAKRLDLRAGDYVGSLARIDGDETDLGCVAVTQTVAALLSHKTFSELLARHKDMAQVRESFQKAGLLVGDHVFAGNATLPLTIKAQG